MNASIFNAAWFFLMPEFQVIVVGVLILLAVVCVYAVWATERGNSKRRSQYWAALVADSLSRSRELENATFEEEERRIQKIRKELEEEWEFCEETIWRGPVSSWEETVLYWIPKDRPDGPECFEYFQQLKENGTPGGKAAYEALSKWGFLKPKT